jgi:cytochrome P450
MGIATALFPRNTHPQAVITEIARRYNLDGIFYLDMWPLGPSMVVLTSPELGDQVYLKKPLGVHEMSAEFMRPIIGPNSLVTVNGPLWKKLHHQMQPAFSWTHIRSTTGVMIEEMRTFGETLDGLAATGEAFSMDEKMAAPIFDIVGRIVWSVPLNAQQGGSPMLEDIRLLIDLSNSQSNPALMLNYPAKAKRWWQRRQLRSRLDPVIEAKIKERWDLVKFQQTTTARSRREQAGLLDLMLREMLEEKKTNGAVEKGKGKEPELTAEDMQILLSK